MVIRSVNAAERSRSICLRIIIHILAVERHAKIAEHLLENLHDTFVFRREKNFVALPLLDFFNDGAYSEFYGGGIG